MAEATTKLVALDNIIYEGKIYMKGEEVEVLDSDVDLLEGNNHAGKPSSKDAKEAQKDDEPAPEPEPEPKAKK